MKTFRSLIFHLGLCAGLVTGATAGTYTWTRDSVATQTWTATDNWAGGAVHHDPGTSADILTFYNDTTTALANGVNSITTSVPSALMMNVLTLNGRGAASGASNIVIATNASTWTLGGTSPAVNLNGVNGTAPLAYTVAPNLVLGANATFTGAGTATFHFSGNISGGFSLAKSGASALTLSGSNSYSGGTTVAGTLVLKNGSAGGTGGINFAGNTLKLDNTGTGQNILLANGLTNNGGTLVNVAGNNKITSQLSINSGFSNTYIQVDAGTTLECAGNYIFGTTGRNLHLQGNGNGLYSGNLVFGGNTLQKSGAGTWTLSGANTYTRDTLVNNGTLKLDTSGSLKFVPTSNGVCNKITGPGTAILNGTFNIDLSGVDMTPGNTWTLVNVANRSGSLAGITTTPALSFTRSSGVWTARDGSSIWQYAEASGVLSLTADSTGHASWITVDPTEPLTGSWSSEWNTDGNLDGWTGVGTSAVVSGGMVSGTATTTAPRIEWTNFPAGPDLDLGYNDFVEVRIQVPASYAGPIRIFYGTTLTPGVSTARVLTIPAASIPKDGAFHTYRISVGLEPGWRSTLRDLRIDPVGGAGTVGMAFAVDYIRIGDLPGDVYLPNTTDQPVTAYELSSKRFRFIWDANRATNNGINATIARGCLRNAEEAWQTYVKRLGYREPAESTDPGQRDGNKYKVNFLCINDGFWMGGSPTSFGYLNIAPGGLQVDPPSWVIPHELMHVFQMHNTSGHVPGEWWETHANYGRERWLHHYANLYPNTSNLEAQAVRDAHLMMSSGRNYYLTWLPFLYVDENPDALPDLYDGLVAKMWQETQAGEFPMMALDRLTPTTSLKDIIGYYARRGATFDYAQQATINATLNNQDPARNARHVFTDLVRRADAPTWWRVPLEKAPAQGAYAIHQLVPEGSGAGRVVTVNLHGLADAARGADWRASFIAVSDTGVERYTPLWSAGSSSITLAEDENTLYLSVAGTPDIFHYGGHDEALYPFRSHPSRSRFHYEVQVTGATPRERNNGATTGLVQHANGGGWKASTATVDATAFIGPNARVLGAAQVRNTARIEDYAVVQDNAQVLNNAVVSGHAWVRGSAVVQDYARVRDWAIVDGGTISGNGRVLEHATVNGNVTDSAVAKGSAISFGGTLSGNAVVDGDYSFNKSISNGVTFGHLPYVGIPDNFTRATPAWLYAAYDFATAHDSRVLDANGVTDGYTIGSPAWTAADAKRSGFLNFNGADQYAVLDRSITDTRAFSFAAWVKPLGGAANQAVLWLGATPTKRMTFTPDDGTGHARFSIVNGGADQTLTAPTALPTGVWSHVAVTLDGTTGTLYVNGTAAATGAVSIVPDQLLAANDAGSVQHNYLARAQDTAQPMFHGALDGVEFYSKALTATDIAAMQPLVFPPYTPTVAGTLYVDLRASDFSGTTWPNPGTLGDFTAVGGPAKLGGIAGTPFDGVQFDGNDAFQGPNSVADLDGSSDRSIEVWVFNPAFSDEETVVSWGHRGSSRRNMAFNFGSNGSYPTGAATHWDDDVGWTTTPNAGAWHHVVYTYASSTVNIYVDGAVAVAKTLGGTLNTFAEEPINIGCQRDAANGARSFYFAGYLNTVRIHGGVLTPAQVSANFALGPSGPPPNTAPQLDAIPDQTLDFGASASIPITVGDADTALAAVTVSGSAANATLVPAANLSVSGTGASRSLLITPAPGLTGATTITLLASDGAATASRTFQLTVLNQAETWRRRNFSTTANAGDAADDADPDGDGTPNLLERAFGGDPKRSDRNLLPVVDDTAPLLSIRYQTATAASDLLFTVEESPDLSAGSWSAASGASTVLSDDGIVRHIRFSTSAATAKSKFLHVRVTQP